MVHEKMKLKILEKISKDLSVHIEQVFTELLNQQKTDYQLQDVIAFYLSDQKKDKGLIKMNNKTSEVVNTKRDIAFIYYCLSCPFYRELGVKANLPKEKRETLSIALNLSRKNIQEYIISAKHQFRFYSDYREMIERNILQHLKYNN